MATLALPALGMALSTSRAGTKAFQGGWRWSEGAPMRRFGLISGTAAVIALLGFVWYPNGEYKPIQQGERGTVQGAVAQFGQMPTGRPSLTPDREQQLGGAPTVHDSSGTTDQGSGEPTSTSPTETTTTTATTTTQPTDTTGSTTTSPTDTTGSTTTTP
jgi:hypothetical protein